VSDLRLLDSNFNLAISNVCKLLGSGVLNHSIILPTVFYSKNFVAKNWFNVLSNCLQCFYGNTVERSKIFTQKSNTSRPLFDNYQTSMNSSFSPIYINNISVFHPCDLVAIRHMITIKYRLVTSTHHAKNRTTTRQLTNRQLKILTYPCKYTS